MTPLTNQQRRALARRAHALKPRITVGRAGLSDALIAQLRQALAKTPLLKVRIDGVDRDAADAIAAEMAERIPAALVGRIGFVVTLYQPAVDAAIDDETDSAADGG
ncbi:MAG: YhbY family RNA-binding protein [Phycisphaerae bacterium]|nr:YhbY family RNA-binding protein [Phycisphaerae bacterium]